MQNVHQTIRPAVVDNPTAPEIYVNGPVNISINGPCATFTFTTVRPNIKQAFDGKPITDQMAPVAVRVTMPLEMLAAMKATLNKMLVEQPMVLGPSTKQ